MTAAELFELSQLAGNNSLTGMAILLSMISGYMIIAYNAGDKLTTLQITVANAIYVTGCAQILYANFSNIRDAMMTRQLAPQLAPEISEGSGMSATAMATIYIVIQMSFVLGSLVFMWQVRRGDH